MLEDRCVLVRAGTMLRPDPLWCKGIAQDGVGWMSDLSSFVSVFFWFLILSFLTSCLLFVIPVGEESLYDYTP